MELQLPSPAVINRLSLSEDIARGERVESFVVEVWDNGGWQELCRGTNIGFRRILRFPPVSVSRLRVRILSARAPARPLSVAGYCM